MSRSKLSIWKILLSIPFIFYSIILIIFLSPAVLCSRLVEEIISIFRITKEMIIEIVYDKIK